MPSVKSKSFWMPAIGFLFALTCIPYSFAATLVATDPVASADNSDTVTATQAPSSALQQKEEQQKESAANVFGIALMRPSYILPFYYTGSPLQLPDTPDNQNVMSSEFKGQLSVAVPVMRFWQNKAAAAVAYTQVSYWQVYAKSQYFRETNYEPEAFLSYNFSPKWLADVGLDHQSNGQGGEQERSWNRLYTSLNFSGEQWLASIKPWLLVFQGQSSDLHNPDITDYLGHEQMLFAYKFSNRQELSLLLRNTLDSGFKRGAEEATWSIPLGKTHFCIYTDFFSGYGQSLIEYNHYTNAAGIGIALNDWI